MNEQEIDQLLKRHMDGPDCRVLHWMPEENVWQQIDWHQWNDAHAFEDPPRPLSVSAGWQWFVHCDLRDGEVINISPFRYQINDDGVIVSHRDVALPPRESIPALRRALGMSPFQFLVKESQHRLTLSRMNGGIYRKLGCPP